VEHRTKPKYSVVETRVSEHGKTETLNAQKIGTSQKYIVGHYDIELFTLPRRYATVFVEQSATSNVIIDAPGTLNLNGLTPVTGQIFERKSDGSIEWVCNLKEDITSDRWVLQPGNYLLVYRKLKLKSASYTQERKFSIYSNKSISINL
jgi:Ca-activated chloride channel homolog